MKTLLSFELFSEVNHGSSILVKEDKTDLSLSIENWAFGETFGLVSAKITISNIIKLGQQLTNLGKKLQKFSDKEDEEFQKLISEDEAFLKVLERLGE
jgi:hypothetical protein